MCPDGLLIAPRPRHQRQLLPSPGPLGQPMKHFVGGVELAEREIGRTCVAGPRVELPCATGFHILGCLFRLSQRLLHFTSQPAYVHREETQRGNLA